VLFAIIEKMFKNIFFSQRRNWHSGACVTTYKDEKGVIRLNLQTGRRELKIAKHK
jgi:hypothetical protein